jgi:hypothetical protein
MKRLDVIKRKWKLWVGIFIMLVGMGLSDYLILSIPVILVGFVLVMSQSFSDRNDRRNGVA